MGLWFEETLDSSDGPPANTAKETNEETNTERNATVVPDNREPHGVCLFQTSAFISTFSFVNNNLFLYSLLIVHITSNSNFPIYESTFDWK